jgi:hypothetical protein
VNPETLAVILAFNTGLIIGAGIAWGLVMYKWEPIEPCRCEELKDIM